MDTMSLRKTMAVYTPIGGNVSLPFVVKKNDEIKIRWFIYDVIQKDNELGILVKQAYTMDETGRVAIRLNLNIESIVSKEPQKIDLQRNDHIEEVVSLFNIGKYDEINNRLKNSCHANMLHVYYQIASK